MTGESRRAGVSAERVAAVLAEHQVVFEQTLIRCACDWSAADVSTATRARLHRAHVAATVAAALDDGLRERVEALIERWEIEPYPRSADPGWNNGADMRRERDADELRAILAAQPTASGDDQ